MTQKSTAQESYATSYALKSNASNLYERYIKKLYAGNALKGAIVGLSLIVAGGCAMTRADLYGFHSSTRETATNDIKKYPEFSKPFVLDILQNGISSGAVDKKSLYDSAFTQEDKDKFAVENMAQKPLSYRLSVLAGDVEGLAKLKKSLSDSGADINKILTEIELNKGPSIDETTHAEKSKTLLEGKVDLEYQGGKKP